MPWSLPPDLPLALVAAGTQLARIHRPDLLEPFFGPPPGGRADGRFHDPQGEFRVCLLGENPTASFAETFLRSRLVTLDELNRRRLSRVEITRDLRLVMARGPGLARMKCTAELTSSMPPYTEPQRFARAVFEHPERPDGIDYLCRHDNELRAIALFDSAADALALRRTESLTDDRARLLGWLQRYGLVLG